VDDARIIELAVVAGLPAAKRRRAAAHDAATAVAAAVDAAGIAAAVDAARLVCFPTDTVYGVGGRCRPGTYEAIWAAKGREPDKPLQVIFPSLDLLAEVLRPGPGIEAALRRLLPGPVTLIVPYPPEFDGPPGGGARGGAATLGVRVPPWPPAAAVMADLPWPLVASSANVSGAPPARRLEDVAPVVRAACDLLLDGGEVGGVASTVVDLTLYAASGKWDVLREGALSQAELAAALGGRPT
jgi:L-threonylcarbamoyladenylate synthase